MPNATSSINCSVCEKPIVADFAETVPSVDPETCVVCVRTRGRVVRRALAPRDAEVGLEQPRDSEIA